MTNLKLGKVLNEAETHQLYSMLGAKLANKKEIVLPYDIRYHILVSSSGQTNYNILFGEYFKRQELIVSSMAIDKGVVRKQEVVLAIFDSTHPQIVENSIQIKPYREVDESYAAPGRIVSKPLVSTYLRLVQEISQEKIKLPKKPGEFLTMDCILAPFEGKVKTVILTLISTITHK